MKVNLKFLTLGVFFLILGLLLRSYFLHFSKNLDYLGFWAGITSFSFVFFTFAGFAGKDHVWWKMVMLAVSLLLFNFILNQKAIDTAFLNNSIGILTGMALATFSFLPAVKKWLTS